jgi:tRNA-splicing ligase RtcB
MESITGKTLIQMGYKQSKWFNTVIDYANKNNLTENEIREYIDKTVPKTVEPPAKPIEFQRNILVDDEHEQKNLDSVTEAMNNVLMTPTAVAACIMPDACPTGKDEIPVGGVVVTRNAIHPRMHSADICCSVMTTDMGYVDPKVVLDHAMSVTHFGIGGRDRDNQLCKLPSELKEKIMGNYYLNSEKSVSVAHSHLGTQGDGNHFLFVGRSKATGRTHLVTHHGSRGFGAMLYKVGVNVAESICKDIAPNVSPKNAWIPYYSPEGHMYWNALQIVREWTKLNHECIHDAILQKLSVYGEARFWNEHNFVFKDNDLFYHAKGATPMYDKFIPDSVDGLRLVPLNMGQPILIMKRAWCSFGPHGAGRNFSRSEHKKTKLVNKTPEELFAEETKGLDVRFFSGRIDVSELPSAYKDATKVKEQIDTFKLGTVVDEIEPYGCIMAGHIDKPWGKK